MSNIKKKISRLEGKIKKEKKIIESSQNVIVVLECRIQNLYDLLSKELDGCTAKLDNDNFYESGFTVTED